MPLPVLSTSGVLESLWKRLKVVPAGNEELAIVISNVSTPLPVFWTTLVNTTVLAWAAFAIVWPVNVTETFWITVKSAVLLLNGPTGAPVPGSYVKLAVFCSKPAGVDAGIVIWNVSVPD